MNALANRSRQAVFLSYHSIADRGAPYLTLPPKTFERQLSLLRRLGYRSGGVDELERLARGERLPQPTAFLTFDDGFRDNFSTAQPIMLKHGFCPMIFVMPPFLEEGRPFDWPEITKARDAHPDLMRSLTWAEVGEMVEQGAEIGSHTLSHPHLGTLDDEALVCELRESRLLIEERVGRCALLAYPFGEWDERVANAARAAGYSFAFSLPRRSQRDVGAHCIPRVNVDARDRSARFFFKVHPVGRRILLSSWGGRLRPSQLRTLLRRPAGGPGPESGNA